MAELFATSHLAASGARSPFPGVAEVFSRDFLLIKSRQPEAARSRLSLPSVGESLVNDGRWYISQSPREWLVVAESGSGPHREELGSALAGSAVALVDVSDAVFALSIERALAEMLLPRGSGMNMRDLEPGRCIRGKFAQLRVTLAAEPRSNAIWLLSDRPYAPYLWAWLAQTHQNLKAE